MDRDEFDILDKWKKQADEEFRNSEFWEDSYEGGYEITEDGSVFLGNQSWIHNVVTPFKDINIE